MRIQKLNSDTKKNLLEDLLKRSPNNYGQYEASVKEILDKVKEEKDAAVFAYTAKFDGAELTADTIEVTDAEIEEAYAQVDDTLLTVIRKAKDNIESYHAKQRQNSWFDSKPAEDHSASQSRRVCAGRKGSLSVFGTDECDAGKGCRCG